LKYDFIVKDHNIPCHLDIERDLKVQSNGLFTFTLRVNNGLIMDYVNYRNPDASEYSAILNSLETQCKITRSSGDDCATDGVRGDNIHSNDKER
jgi:hypothetical protein